MGDWPNRFKDLSDVGQTTGGPPAAGTWSQNDVAVDSNGTFWVCTVGGSPGTWQAANASELGYAQIIADPTAITSTSLVDVSGLSIGVTVGTRPIVVEVFIATAYNSTANMGGTVAIVEGTTTQSLAGMVSATANAMSAINVRARLSPSAGAHTYKVQAQVGAFGAFIGGSLQLKAAATYPAFIRAVQA